MRGHWWRLSPLPDLARALARALGWLTALSTLLILAFVVRQWPDAGGASVPGLVGASVALLTDSWQMTALGDRHIGIPPLMPVRITVHDTFSLALSLGGVIMILLLNFRGDYRNVALDMYRGAAEAARRPPAREKWLGVAVWSLTLIVAWRIFFIVCSCWECYQESRRGRGRRGLFFV